METTSPKPIRLTRFCPHKPTAPQAYFMGLTAREALYGGAAGGGKSDALLMDALQFVDEPGYAALLLRRSYKDLALPGAIMDRALEWLRPHRDVHWDAGEKTFVFPMRALVGPEVPRATLTFGYLATANDRYRYQGSAYQYIGFDELTQFAEDDYLYLLSRLRRLAGMTVPVRLRGGSNPGGIGHEWVRSRLIPWRDPRTGRLLVPHDHNGRARVFVPAKLADNPFLNAQEYAESLAELPPVLRAQLLHGDWGARPPGEMFDRLDFEIVEAFDVTGAALCRAWDLAGTKKRRPGHDPDWSAGVLMALRPDGSIGILDVVRRQDRPSVIADLVAQTARNDRARYGAVAIDMEQEPGSAGVAVAESYARLLLGHGFTATRSTGDKAARAVPYSSAVRAKLVSLVEAPWNADYLSEIEAFPQESVHDDQVDGSSLAFQHLTSVPALAGATVAPSRTTYHAARHSLTR
jgi:predicted phage terminase large subunit-like protein